MKQVGVNARMLSCASTPEDEAGVLKRSTFVLLSSAYHNDVISPAGDLGSGQYYCLNKQPKAETSPVFVWLVFLACLDFSCF